MGWRSLCVAQTSRSRRDRARERDAPTTNLQLGDAPLNRLWNTLLFQRIQPPQPHPEKLRDSLKPLR